jgi:hypothetical protein
MLMTLIYLLLLYDDDYQEEVLVMCNNNWIDFTLQSMSNHTKPMSSTLTQTPSSSITKI